MARSKGFRVFWPQKPDWGLGHVLADDGGANGALIHGHRLCEAMALDGCIRNGYDCTQYEYNPEA